LITHSRLSRIGSKLQLPPAMTQPISDGVNSITVYHPIVVMLRLSSSADDTITIDPGSR
jgi:hypothetical protein